MPLLISTLLCGGQIIDRQQADHLYTFLLDFCPPFLFSSIHDHERMSHRKSCLSR